MAQFGLSHLSKHNDRGNKSYRFNKFVIDEENYFIFNKNEKNSLVTSKTGFAFSLERAIYRTEFNPRFISFIISTKSHFKLTFDLIISTGLSSSNLIGQVVYLFKYSADRVETVRTSHNKSTFSIEHSIQSSNIYQLKFIRNLCIDTCKGLKITCDQCMSLKESGLRVYQIGLEGKGEIENGVFYDEEIPSIELARQAGDYLVSAQNVSTGGWIINVTRKFDKYGKISLKSGWYSAMAQGQAISLLCRLYSLTKSRIYLNSATSAVDLFFVDVKSNGIRSEIHDGVWFEEYPTQPFSLYVLNGFVYSIFGLADYLHFCGNEPRVFSLFNDSIRSLANRLNFYDIGTRTLYDLRHLSDPELYPNVARWDYHTLHVSQLYFLADWIQKYGAAITNNNHDELLNYTRLFRKVASRWHNYVYGVWNRESQIKSDLD